MNAGVTRTGVIKSQTLAPWLEAVETGKGSPLGLISENPLPNSEISVLPLPDDLQTALENGDKQDLSWGEFEDEGEMECGIDW